MAMLPPERRWRWIYAMADAMARTMGNEQEQGRSYRILVQDVEWIWDNGIMDKLFRVLDRRGIPYTVEQGADHFEVGGVSYHLVVPSRKKGGRSNCHCPRTLCRREVVT